MFYYTYIIYINNPESSLYGKIYFGQHSTNNLNDKYIASGRIIKDYIKKYPGQYYRKILNLYNSKEELDKAEYQLIHPHLGKSYCLNLREGGEHPNFTEEQRKLISERTKLVMQDPEIRSKCAYWKGKESPNKGKELTVEHKQKLSNKKIEYFKTHSSWNKGLTQPKSTRDKISNKLKGFKRSEESRKKQGQTIKGHKCYIEGKHRVYDNEEHTKWHFEY